MVLTHCPCNKGRYSNRTTYKLVEDKKRGKKSGLDSGAGGA